MFVRTLKLYNFRNLEDRELEFSPGLNVIFGRNGQGKTNIIETLNILSSTKSFRASKTRELIRWGEKEASIHAEISEAAGDLRLGALLTGQGKEFLMNGKRTGAVEFVGTLLCVAFSPSDIEIIKGGPLIRRRFLDRHTVDLQPAILRYLLHYNAALKNKLSLLKSRSPSGQQLDSWDRVLSDAAAQIMRSRDEFVSKLRIAADGYYQRFAEIDGHVHLELKPTIRVGEISSPAIYNFLREKRSEEIDQRTALYGPHRDDLQITVEGRSSRLYASQGQSKSLAIALKLAVIDLLQSYRGESPVILLDDVDSELDSERLRQLYRVILEGRRQVFITGTAVNESLKGYQASYRSFSVHEGAIEAADKE